MVAPREQVNVEAFVRDPGDFFASPMDVVVDERLNRDEKERILEAWSSDAQQLSQAEAENMAGSDRSRLQEVHLALLELRKRH